MYRLVGEITSYSRREREGKGRREIGNRMERGEGQILKIRRSKLGGKRTEEGKGRGGEKDEEKAKGDGRGKGKDKLQIGRTS